MLNVELVEIDGVKLFKSISATGNIIYWARSGNGNPPNYTGQHTNMSTCWLLHNNKWYSLSTGRSDTYFINVVGELCDTIEDVIMYFDINLECGLPYTT